MEHKYYRIDFHIEGQTYNFLVQCQGNKKPEKTIVSEYVRSKHDIKKKSLGTMFTTQVDEKRFKNGTKMTKLKCIENILSLYP